MKGRPMKYAHILLQLKDDKLYAASTIAQFAASNDLLPEGSTANKVRIAMGRFKQNHQFPKKGDGTVSPKGRNPIQAWFGWRWKAPIQEKQTKGRGHKDGG